MLFMPSRVSSLFLLALIVTLSASSAKASDEIVKTANDDKGILTFSLENDLVSGTDSNYTNGARLSYISPEGDIPNWVERGADALPFFAADGHKRFEFSAGQSMFTPANLSIRELQVNDRPYAGFLYGTAGLTSDTGNRLDDLELTLGMVGPASLAEQTQKTVHSIIGSPDPQGWRNQLHNEPGVILSYERKWRKLYEASPFGLGVDVTPSLGVSAGNIYDYLSTGAIVRLGYDLPSDYGPPLLRPHSTGSDFFVPEKDFSWYLFAGVDGRAVARNIFLDGNSYGSSHSVDKYPFVGGVEAGIAVTIKSVRIAYTQTFNSKEFSGQPQYNNYGALTASVRY